MLDCAVVGGGPAGLTAAIYLARFRLAVRVFDAGESRAALIPWTHNHAGFPQGVSGVELVARMREQARRFGAEITPGTVDAVDGEFGAFRVSVGDELLAAKSVLLATGAEDRRPPMPEDLHRRALASGRIRYCPVCDGFEVIDRTVGVLGAGSHGAREAEFLRSYTPRLTLVPPEAPLTLSDAERRRLGALGVRVVETAPRGFSLDDGGILVEADDGPLAFEALYIAMGSKVRSELARAAGAKVTESGCVLVDAHQRTTLKGLYAAGDVVVGLDQISHAMGEAGVAATAIRNDLFQNELIRLGRPSDPKGARAQPSG